MATIKPAALVVGATGALGKALTRDLLQTGAFRRVTTIGRRPVEFPEGSKVPTENLVQIIVDFENLEAHRKAFRGHDIVFGTLGITRRLAGSPENFVKIDQGYIVNSAKIAAEENPGNDEGALSPIHYVYCSSVGANANSPFLYMRSKGETENALADKCGFSRVTIVRPSGLDVEEPRARGNYWYETLIFNYITGPLNWMGFNASAPVSVLAKGMRRAAIGDVPEELGVKEMRRANGTILSFLDPKQLIDLGKGIGLAER
ncbi:hypothetical protein BC937DRAFT_89138 [Endogone sp. FLAS-F59071]|nr:hypothetical protein BC937DRAFT_89138 [Endogone sp. FLAS-F59071]|eukprot:RUS18114.1 hypothetical protein BC937DRAFT_89138 [Endogone sp. FLAS-F59071]